MLTTLLKGVLFVIVMAFYSGCVWRTVNEYFGKEFKTYIQLDPDVRQDKELRTLVLHDNQEHPPDTSPTQPTTLLRVITSTTIEANNYNEPRIGAATNPNGRKEDAKQITGDKNENDFSITVKSIKHSTSNAEDTTTNHHRAMAHSEMEESRAPGDDDVANAFPQQHLQCLSSHIRLKDPADWQPLCPNGAANENSVVTGDEATNANVGADATTFNVGGNQNESKIGNSTPRIIIASGDGEDRDACTQSTPHPPVPTCSQV